MDAADTLGRGWAVFALADGSAVSPAPAIPEGQLSAEAIAILDEAYKWILVPEQPAQGDQLNALRWNVVQLRGDVTERGSVVDRVAHRLEQDELLLTKWSPHGLKRELDQWLWKEDAPHVSAAQLWDYFARYPYLSRLRARGVLGGAIKDGARTDDYWGYAKGVQDDNYEGLSLAEPVSEVYFDGSDLLVRPETAQAATAAGWKRSGWWGLRGAVWSDVGTCICPPDQKAATVSRLGTAGPQASRDEQRLNRRRDPAAPRGTSRRGRDGDAGHRSPGAGWDSGQDRPRYLGERQSPGFRGGVRFRGGLRIPKSEGLPRWGFGWLPDRRPVLK